MGLMRCSQAIGNVTQKIVDEGIWNDTLIVLHADNGGPIYASGIAGANNYPLKGGKMANWEGGIRVNAFAAGGALPDKVLGTKQEGLIAAGNSRCACVTRACPR